MRPDRSRRRAAPALVAVAIVVGVVLIARPLSAMDVLLVVSIAALAVIGAHEVLTGSRVRDRVVGGALLVA